MSSAAILINVDQNESMRSARNRILSSAGFLVYDAATGDQALELVERHRPDLVLLSVPLPDVDHAELCRRVKSTPNGAPASVLQIGTVAREGDADAHLNEPVNPEVLVAIIRLLLRVREAERELVAAKACLETAGHDLRRSNEDLHQFAFVASHDLKEPLRTVTTFIQLIEQEAQDRLTAAEKGYFAHIVSGTNRMRSLIQDLLAYSQAGRGNQPKRSVDMTGIVAWAIEDLGRRLDDAGATVQVDEPLPRVWGDFAQLGQAVKTLLSNAIKYRKPETKLLVEIRTQQDDPGECVISVRDNGIGIAPEYCEKVFAPFKRLHGQEISGTGIGLAVCRRIVEAHGGHIWVESELGVGSTFLVRLPKAPESGRTSI